MLADASPTAATDSCAYATARSIQSASSHTEYFLAKHVFCCVLGESAVLLDLARDKYLVLPTEGLEAAGIDVQSSTRVREHGASSLFREGATAKIQELLVRGLITPDMASRNPVVPTTLISPCRTLRDISGDDLLVRTSSHATALSMTNFLVAATSATLALRFRSIQVVVEALRRRRTLDCGSARTVNLDLCTAIVANFNNFRPLFPRQYLCLFDSLALLNLLARHRQHPLWVFGVQIAPFAAHCWVQWDDVVLNDTVEEVRAYTPIMMV